MKNQERKWCVYKHTSPNGKVYIGITSQKPEHRWGKDGNGYKTQQHFWNAIQKYGWTNFKHEIIVSELSEEEAYKKEIELIEFYNSTNQEYGYNCSVGGEKSAYGVVVSEEYKQKCRQRVFGENNPFYGKRHTNESKEKISKALKERWENDEYRQKAIMNHIGTQAGEKHPMYGKHWSKEHKDKMSRSHDHQKTSVIQKNIDSIIINIFDSAKEAERKTGVSQGNISRCCRNLIPSVGGFIWRYRMEYYIVKIKELTKELLMYCDAYYNHDYSIISDKEYDKKFDELKRLEDVANFWLANSPTRKVQGQVLDCFQKVKHSKPMLSAAKTKDINEIKKFIGNKRPCLDFYCSYKLDGLTLCVRYENGKFTQAITRGNGEIGEDVTEQAKMIENLPMQIPYERPLELRGECVVDWDSFHKINKTLKEPYSHPRNLAAGSLRNLDTNITKQRNLSYIVFECISDLYSTEWDQDDNWSPIYNDKADVFEELEYLGFDVVERYYGTIDDAVQEMTPETYKFPVDGLVFEFENIPYSKSLSSTAHHEGCRMALKWVDNVYETTLRDVIWDVGRSGVISPVAVFDEVDLDGALTTKATLHNLSVIENLELGIGDTITVYRSNMVIPKIDDNLTRSNTLKIPDTCPCCSSKTEIKHTDNSKFLMCINPNCPAKSLAKFTHFVSRNCANIDGLSERTLEALISRGFLHTFKDIYHLKEHKNELINIEGLGEKSVTTLLESIEKSRDIKLENFITALGIPNIGQSAAKTISNAFHGNHYDFIQAFTYGYDFTQLEDFGEVMNKSLYDWWNSKDPMVELLPMEFNFILPTKVEVKENPFSGKILCVTGKLEHFTRDSINAKITELGAKAASSVSKKTDYLITNEASGSSKYKKAAELNIPIISENEFLRMIVEYINKRK